MICDICNGSVEIGSGAFLVQKSVSLSLSHIECVEGASNDVTEQYNDIFYVLTCDEMEAILDES